LVRRDREPVESARIFLVYRIVMPCQRETALARRSARRPPFGSLRAAVICAIGASILAGCRTADYTARKMPPALRVAPAPANSGINLERMGEGGSGTAQIGAGDLVEITLVSGNGEERVTPVPARVAHDGTLLVPLVGAVAVGGLEPIAAEQRIAAAAIERGIYRQPCVTLTVTEPAVNRITVLGAVSRPGVVELPRGASDLASALAAAGGLAKDAGTQVDIMHRNTAPFLAGQPSQFQGGTDGVRLASYVDPAHPAVPPFGPPAPLAVDGAQSPLPVAMQVPQPATTRIDLAQATGPIAPQSRKLDDRDVVMVLPQERRVIHVSGLVKRPDQFEVPQGQDVRLLDAIALSGGTTSPLADKVLVIRQLQDMSQPAVIKASIAGAKRNGDENLLLAAGDLVSVESTATTMALDTVSKFFRMAIGFNGRVTGF
jgi:polysaccharide export outer membrane protein